jgi:hypothetical protein
MAFNISIPLCSVSLLHNQTAKKMKTTDQKLSNLIIHYLDLYYKWMDSVEWNYNGTKVLYESKKYKYSSNRAWKKASKYSELHGMKPWEFTALVTLLTK